MKKNIAIMLCFVGATMLTACSDKEDTTGIDGGKITINAEQFTLTEKGYGEETDVTSRAAAQQPESKVVNLGNGVEAELSIEREPAHKAVTRATEISNQHYTINAYKPGVGRVGQLKGTVSGSGATKTFTPDASTPKEMHLAPGTYTFTCYNDKVMDDGSSSYTVQQANAGQALFAQTTATVGNGKYAVNFEMKHQAARLRFELSAYWDITGIKATASAANGLTSVTHGDEAANDAETTGAVTTSAFTFPTATTPANYVYTSTSDYQYILCSPTNGPVTASNLKINFTAGSLYEKALAGKAMTLGGFPRTKLAANESYKVKVKLYYTYTYLFQDGSIGSLLSGKHAGKTAIGAMISSNKAMALTDAVVGGNDRFKWSNTSGKKNAVTTTAFAPIWNDMDGFNNTWNAANSATGTAHANDVSLPAFYAAAHYTPLATQTGAVATTSSWYLPAMGEWKLAAAAMAGYNMSTLTAWNTPTKVAWKERFMEVICVQAGGTSPLAGSGLPASGWYWASDEYSNDSGYQIVTYPSSTYSIIFVANPKSVLMRVRPFVIKN